jgi:hypothetical protein
VNARMGVVLAAAGGAALAEGCSSEEQSEPSAAQTGQAWRAPSQRAPQPAGRIRLPTTVRRAKRGVLTDAWTLTPTACTAASATSPVPRQPAAWTERASAIRACLTVAGGG